MQNFDKFCFDLKVLLLNSFLLKEKSPFLSNFAIFFRIVDIGKACLKDLDVNMSEKMNDEHLDQPIIIRGTNLDQSDPCSMEDKDDMDKDHLKKIETGNTIKDNLDNIVRFNSYQIQLCQYYRPVLIKYKYFIFA